MICSLRLGGGLIFALFRLLRAQSNCFGQGTNARFGRNVRFRPTAAAFAYPAAAPLGAIHSALSVGAYKTGNLQVAPAGSQALNSSRIARVREHHVA
jgi:hypothetical protein